jgi:hypothetical protein
MRLVADPTTWLWSEVLRSGGTNPIVLRDGRVASWQDDRAVHIWDPTTQVGSISVNGLTLRTPETSLIQVPDGRLIAHGQCSTDGYGSGGSYFWAVNPDDPEAYWTLHANPLGTLGGACLGNTLLPNGSILAVGGRSISSGPNGGGTWHKDVASFDPLHNWIAPMASLPTPMTVGRAIHLIGSKVLVIAGQNSFLVPSTLLYDPATNRWSTFAAWPGGFVQDSLVLPDGSVLARDGSGELFRLQPNLLPPSYPGSTYHPVAPTRLLDTRTGNGLAGPFLHRSARTFDVAGREGIPLDALAVTGNLTATGSTSAGYVALGPVASGSPSTSTLNFPNGDTRANGVTVPLAPDGTLSATFVGRSSSAQVSLVFDVTGYFTTQP